MKQVQITPNMTFWRQPARHVITNWPILEVKSVNEYNAIATPKVAIAIVYLRPRNESDAYIPANEPGTEHTDTIK